MNLRDARRFQNSSDHWVASEAGRVLEASRLKKRRAAPKRAARRTRQEAKAETKAARRALVYAAVDERSRGFCESCHLDVVASQGSSRDHFWGRAREESAESVWKLCATCDHDKTLNRPNRKWWLGKFRRHAAAYGYLEQVAKVDRMVALEIAQHPETK